MSWVNFSALSLKVTKGMLTAKVECAEAGWVDERRRSCLRVGAEDGNQELGVVGVSRESLISD